MGSLSGKSPASTYKSLLKVGDETNGISTSVSQIEDGEGTSSCLSLSDDSLQIQPQNDNTTTTLRVRALDGTNLVTVDTTNEVVKVGTTLTPANSQIVEFNAYDLTPVAGTHHFVSKGTAKYNSPTGVTELANGTGTDPETSLATSATTDELITNLFVVPVNSTIDACKFMVSTHTDTDTVINVHLYKYTIKSSGATNDGALAGGVLLASGQATAVDRNCIKTVACTIDSSAVTAGEVLACFVENETNTNVIRLNTQVLYHFN
tara:strand:- start:9 stop:797 length:789 start_codon:yes stop_codon:yes gene_type:complete